MRFQFFQRISNIHTPEVGGVSNECGWMAERIEAGGLGVSFGNETSSCLMAFKDSARGFGEWVLLADGRNVEKLFCAGD